MRVRTPRIAVCAAGAVALAFAAGRDADAANNGLDVAKTYSRIPSLGTSKKAVGRLLRCGWGYISASRAWGCWYHAIPGSQAGFDNTAFELKLARDVKKADRDSLNADVRAITVNLDQVPRRDVLRFGKIFDFTQAQVREVIVHQTRIVNQHRLRLSGGGSTLEIRELTYR